jgi:hypothetical protein
MEVTEQNADFLKEAVVPPWTDWFTAGKTPNFSLGHLLLLRYNSY